MLNFLSENQTCWTKMDKKIFPLLCTTTVNVLRLTPELNPERIWLFVENDCRIMEPMMKLIFDVYRCLWYEEKIYGVENLKAHLLWNFWNRAAIWVWLANFSVGLLHFEMTAGKSFMGLCQEPFMSEICKELRFWSENAQV